ncbi:MAG TPA: hypothetical protein VK846_11690 [Candidatus Limnocylindria bacterium]|nr:hypothetical protein [Candidatus Limnocylindria bacterium]
MNRRGIQQLNAAASGRNGTLRRIGRLLTIVGWLVAGHAIAAEEFPSPSNVVQRVLKRAELVAQAGQTNHYTYEKRAVVAELDDKDRVIKSTEKLYQVVLLGGLPFPRLVKVQGRELTPKQLERENQREVTFRQRVTHMDLNKKAKRKEGLATQELVDRFEFKIKKREMIEGRPTLVVTFTARPGAPEKTIEDKVFAHVFGTLWVDEQEAEVTKLDASVRGPVPLGWFGAVGSLHQFQATMERSRMPDGVWVNRKSSFWIVARKLLSTMRSRTTEESSGFRRE